MRHIKKLIPNDRALFYLRGCNPFQFADRITKLVGNCLDQINEFYNVLSTVEDGKDGKDGEQGPMGPTGPIGPMGLVGPKGNDGIGVPSGGNVGQYLKKKSDSDYDTEWSDVQGGGSGNVNSVNGKTGDVVLNASDVDALPANTEYQSPINDLESIRNGAQSGATAYQKPNTGIPSTDFSSAVQASLRNADTALQTETDPTVPAWAKSLTKPSYTAQEVGALPTDTPLFSGDYNDLSNKPTIPVVPTNVSAFENDAGYLTEHQDISGKANKSEMSVTDGTGANSDKTTIQLKSGTSATVIKQHQDISRKQDTLVSGTNIKTINNESVLGSGNINIDISGKEDVTTIVAPVNATDATLPITSLTCEAGKYYRIDVPVETLAVTLPAMTDLTTVRAVVIYLTGGTTPSITISTADSKNVYFQDGFDIEADSTYEINCLFNGVAWVIASVKINVE